MKVAKIADIQNLADGSVIGEMSIQIVKAFPARTGEGKFGTWRVQNCVVKDSTGEGRASFWLNDDMQALVGQTITVKSQGGSKGLQGITVQFSKHAGANELKITDKAAIIDSTTAAFKQYDQALKVNSAIATGQGGGTLADAKRLIFQRAQLYVQCANAAKWAAKEAGIESVEEIQAIRASLFISADKANLWNCFPATQTKPEPAPAPSLPLDEIPMGDEADEFAKEAGW
jgi:adenylosuccinate synthase